MLEPRQTKTAAPDETHTETQPPVRAKSASSAHNDLKTAGPLDLDELFSDDLSDESLDEVGGSNKRKWWVVGVAAVLIVAVIAGFFVVRSRNAKPPTTYQTATIAQGNLAETVTGTGPVSAALYNLNFTASGKIATINITIGQQVKAGQVLAKLDTTQLQDSLNQAQIQANTAWDQEQQQINNCDTERNPPVDCVQLAENQYASALQQLQTAEDNLAGATLTAPHAGIITAINGQVGGAPGSSSSSSGSGFIQIADPGSLTITSDVNETDIAGVQANQQATFTVTAYPGKTFHAVVTSVSQVGSTSSSVVTFPVTLTVDMSRINGVKLYTGMTASVTIVTQRRVNVMLVPTTAVTFARSAALTTSGGFLSRTQVTNALAQASQMLSQVEQQNTQLTTTDSPTAAWVLERNGSKWVVKPVVIGLSANGYYEVLAGLNAGEVVVTGETNGTITTTSSSSGGAGTGTGGGRFGGGGFGGGGFGGGLGGGFTGGAQ
jgi:RND family efflux transporter MFP subunit